MPDAIPSKSTLRIYGLVGGPPTNDILPLGDGGLDFDTALNTVNGVNLLIDFVPILANDSQEIYGIGAYKNTSLGNYESARLALRGGMKPNTSPGSVQILSNDARDAGRKARLVMKTGSAWLPTPEILTIGNLSAVQSLNPADLGELWRVEALDSGGLLRPPIGNWSIGVNGQLCGAIYGTGGGSSQPPTYACSQEYMLALCGAKGFAPESANRTVAPLDYYDEALQFFHATRWAGADESLSVPGQVLAAGEWVAFVLKRIIPAGIVAPLRGRGNPVLNLIGYPTEA